MKTYNEIKKEHEVKISQLIKDCRMFFAFNNEQFEEGKTEKEPDEKYVHLGAGAYMPKSQVNKWIAGLDVIKKWEKAEIKKAKQEDVEILSELHNYECFYVNDITEAVERLAGKYSRERILSVYRKNYKKVMDSIC